MGLSGNWRIFYKDWNHWQSKAKSQVFLIMLQMWINLLASLEISMLLSWITRFVLRIFVSIMPNINNRLHYNKTSMIRPAN